MEEEEARLGSGDSHEEEAALFREVGIGPRPGQREKAVFTADEEDDGKLQAFGGVEGEEGDSFGSRVPGVHLASQGGLGEEGIEVVA